MSTEKKYRQLSQTHGEIPLPVTRVTYKEKKG